MVNKAFGRYTWRVARQAGVDFLEPFGFGSRARADRVAAFSGRVWSAPPARLTAIAALVVGLSLVAHEWPKPEPQVARVTVSTTHITEVPLKDQGDVVVIGAPKAVTAEPCGNLCPWRLAPEGVLLSQDLQNWVTVEGTKSFKVQKKVLYLTLNSKKPIEPIDLLVMSGDAFRSAGQERLGEPAHLRTGRRPGG